MDVCGLYRSSGGYQVEADVRHRVLRLVGLEHHEVLDVAIQSTRDGGICCQVNCQQCAATRKQCIGIVLRHYEADEPVILFEAGGVFIVAVTQNIGGAGGEASFGVLSQGNTCWQIQIELVECDVIVCELAVDGYSHCAARL